MAARRENPRQNPNMDGFTTSREWTAFRLTILNRDDWRCVNCGRDVKGPGRARVDHIKPRRTHPWLAFEPSNCRTLCPTCDNARHAEKGGAPGADVRGCDINGLPLDPNHPWYGDGSRLPYAVDDDDLHA
ncbi:hypothetical protein HpMS107_56610 [Helicobacter pylori]|jgi:HNH endonuclease|uniref:Putative HNH nuclease YajD n=1 Tax=Cupriavidus metallidurans TaxID=119219 RepID=A0A2L0X3L7_9BURK|nr:MULTISPECIES: HNH endonuclease signature motif containing protein [Cupriavidus]AVA34665.1 hypothetical protein C3Z06_14270 [Cupriavidus metallidurans]QBP12289.1 hypothetical protein DDF84_021295 [Cupriavidus metallidurans]